MYKLYSKLYQKLILALMLFLLTASQIVSAAVLDAAFSHSCAIQPDNTVVCWGKNNDGRSSPSSGTFLQISAGVYHTCGVRTDNTVACWGAKHKDKDYGQTIPPNGSFHQVSAGKYHTCGVRTDKTVQCWGKNYAIPPLGTFYEVSAGGEHTCGIRTDNTITCWGNPLFSDDGSPTGFIFRPSDVIGGDILTPPDGLFSQLSAGFGFHCALGIDNTIACWGGNFDKQAMPPSDPIWGFALDKQSVSANDTFSQVTANRTTGCGIRTDNAVVCWGFHGSHPYAPPNGSCTCLNGGPRCLCSNQPMSSNGFTLVSGGAMFVCGIQTNNKVACWGRDGEHADESYPLPPQAIPPKGLIVKSSKPDCLLYGVYDGRSKDSNFFIINYPDLDANPRGEFDKSKNYNIEALDLNPFTNELYAASGKKANEKKRGNLYKVSNGAYILNEIGKTGLEGINAISFHPEGELWGWTQGKGLFKIENVGNNQPEPKTAKVILSYSGKIEIEDITWNNAGTIIYGVENLYEKQDSDEPPEFKGARLFAYDDRSKSVSVVCNELMVALKTEVAALDTLPDNTLLFGFRKNASLSFGVIDVERCEMMMEVEIPSDYNGMKSMAWPPHNCALP